jgi:hypothetical protein
VSAGPVPAARTVLAGDRMDEDPDDRTTPTVQCDGDPGCEGAVAVLILGTGDRLCPHCAADHLHAIVAERLPPFDTEKPAPGDPDPEIEVSEA